MMGGKRPRVLLVYPTPIKQDAFFGFVLPPLGLEKLAANIEDISHVRILDLRFEGDNWLSEAIEFNPDIIGINVKTTLYSSLSYYISDRLKHAIPGATIVLGGLHASSIPEEAVQHGNAVIIGEGERSFRLIVEKADWTTIPGLVYKSANGEVHKGPSPEFVESIDLLPPPARHLRKNYYNYSAANLIKMDLLETSRGCNLYCPFCSPAEIHKGKWRAHSPGYVLQEVKRIASLGAKYVMLSDDNFAVDLDRALEISTLIADEGIKIAFFCFLKPFIGRTDVKKAMVRAGFVMLSYGAESPNPKQLQRFGKGFSDSENFIRTVNREWHEAGARYIGNSFVFGDPLESASDIKKLGDYARELDPTFIEPLYSQPFPGTRYRKELEEKKLLLPHTWDQFTEGRLLVKHPELSEKELLDERVNLWLNFFSPRKIVGAFRVPLYFKNVIGLPLRTVLKYMKACDYCIFGCILEDKFYIHRKREMVKEYIRTRINSFPEKERDMTPFTDEFTDMVGLKPLKQWIGSAHFFIDVKDADRVLTRFSLHLEKGKIQKLNVSLPEQVDLISNSIILELKLTEMVDLICGKDFRKFAAFVRFILFNLFRSVRNKEICSIIRCWI
ncbi:MAG: B12-binding domain-containing radical SAM protein [Candidatus Riflebacteria bacterium]|nr:B12-binding domain-containing radical SAM protein [Candidatus Riflebacteria bacterium]